MSQMQQDTTERATGEPLRPLAAADPARWWGMGEVMRLSVPTVLTTISYTAMQFVDGLMVARVGEEAMSAQLTGGMASFTVICFFIGLVSCVSTFASQNLGAGTPARGAVYAWQGVWVSIIASVGLVVMVPAAPLVMALFGHPPGVFDLEVPYFQVLVAGAVFTMVQAALSGFFVGMHRPVVPFIAGVAGNVANFVVALVLIFGLAGMPRLGLMGAAVGSLTGALVQAAVLAVFFLRGQIARECDVTRQWRPAWGPMKELVRMGTPAGAMFVGDLLMWTIFMAGILGTFGVSALAATNIPARYWPLCFMPAIGVSNAVAAIVGRCCGARQPRLAWRRAHAGLILVEAYMVTAGVTLWLFRDRLVGIFNDNSDPVVQTIATSTFIFIPLCQAFDALNVIFVGALRGAGDTLWPGIAQIVLAYGLGLGGATVVARVWPEWGLYGPWAAVSIYITALGLVMWLRFLGGRWRTMTVVPEPG
jgi:MATE family multidrug resistance protein